MDPEAPCIIECDHSAFSCPRIIIIGRVGNMHTRVLFDSFFAIDNLNQTETYLPTHSNILHVFSTQWHYFFPVVYFGIVHSKIRYESIYYQHEHFYQIDLLLLSIAHTAKRKWRRNRGLNECGESIHQFSHYRSFRNEYNDSSGSQAPTRLE